MEKEVVCINCNKVYNKKDGLSNSSYGFCPCCLKLLLKRTRACKYLRKLEADSKKYGVNGYTAIEVTKIRHEIKSIDEELTKRAK